MTEATRNKLTELHEEIVNCLPDNIDWIQAVKKLRDKMAELTKLLIEDGND